MVERTLSDAMVTHLSELYSSGEHRAFTLRHFKSLHGFNGKEYGWPDLHLDPAFQVLKTPFIFVTLTFVFAKEHVLPCGGFFVVALCRYGGQLSQETATGPCCVTNKKKKGEVLYNNRNGSRNFYGRPCYW
jgi:hypothetical protein